MSAEEADTFVFSLHDAYISHGATWQTDNQVSSQYLMQALTLNNTSTSDNLAKIKKSLKLGSFPQQQHQITNPVLWAVL